MARNNGPVLPAIDPADGSRLLQVLCRWMPVVYPQEFEMYAGFQFTATCSRADDRQVIVLDGSRYRRGQSRL